MASKKTTSKAPKGKTWEGLGRGLPTSFRFSEEAREILYRLSAFEGISQASYLEQLLRREARQSGILPGTPKPISR